MKHELLNKSARQHLINDCRAKGTSLLADIKTALRGTNAHLEWAVVEELANLEYRIIGVLEQAELSIHNLEEK